jgi:23S rRNA pseudouridine2605 synthase
MTVMRLQRALAQAGVASRRRAEVLIADGAVRIDGQVATIGQSVDPDRQVITVKGARVKRLATRWIALHKPLGVVTTADDEEGRRTVFDLIPKPQGLIYVGRLDVMTTGLLLLTTDGGAASRLTHPRYRVPRRYTALVHGKTAAELAAGLKGRVLVDGRPVVPLASRVRPGNEGRSIVDLTLAEGRNAIVRKLFATLGAKVERLARLAYGPIRLGDLEPGSWRVLAPNEVAALYKSVKLPDGGRST